MQIVSHTMAVPFRSLIAQNIDLSKIVVGRACRPTSFQMRDVYDVALRSCIYIYDGRCDLLKLLVINNK